MKEIVPKRDMVQNRPLQVVNKLPTMMKDVRVSGRFFPTVIAQIIW